MSIISELQRRNVIRVAMAYVAVAWLVVQVLDTLAPLFGISDDTARIIVIVLAIGLIPALVLAWVFEWTPDGLKREGEVDHDSAESRGAAKSLDRVIIGVLALAVVYFAFDKFVLDPARDVEIATEAAERARDTALVSSYGEHSIAVVPFADLSPDKDQEYFSDGIAEEIISLLSRIRNLRVIARSSAFAFKGQNLAASVIAEQLNVRYIMEGSVRRAGERLRITTTVIDASTDTQLWSENFDRDFGDIFAIQDEIAGEVVDRLEMQISGKLPVAERVDPESYSYYLQAKHQLTQEHLEATVDADRLLQRSLDIDPTNVAAWILRTDVYRRLEFWGELTKEEAIMRSREAIDRALELDPANPEALATRHFLRQDAVDTWEGELDAVTYSLHLMPADIEANAMAAVELRNFRQFERSLEYSDYALGKDPLCAGCLRTLIRTLMAIGDYERAAEASRQLIAVSGGSGKHTLGMIQLLQGDAETALETNDNSETIPYVILAGRAMINWTLGRTAEFELALAELKSYLDNEEYAGYYIRPEDFLVRVYAWVGRKDEAFEILDRLIDPPESWGPQFWSIDPLFASLHDDPRWAALLEKEGIAPHQVESYRLEQRFPGPGRVPTYELPGD